MFKNTDLKFKATILACISSVVAVLVAQILVDEILGLISWQAWLLSSAIAATVAAIIALPAMAMLQKSLAELTRILKIKAQNTTNMSAPIQLPGDKMTRLICEQLNVILEKVSHITTEFAKTTNDLAFTASKMSDSTERTARNTNQQRTETDMVATAMNEMNVAVDEVAQNANDASLSAKHAQESAEKGIVIARDTQNAISTLVEDINKASSVIHDLEGHSQNIGGVLEVIKGIAEQTNLLALNAAIEAARAGEQGRGFAVVADEVRTLATRTQESTREIETMIERLVNGVNETVSVMKIASEKGQQGSTQIDDTLTSLDEILAAVATIHDMNTQIATAAEEQSHVTNEVSRNVSNITLLASQTSQDANESKQTSEQLADISGKMKILVSDIGTTSSAALDLSSAKAAHLNWKTKLRSFLDGKESLSMEQAVSHRHCEFGKWYYAKGLSQFGHINAIGAVEQPHEELHNLIKEIIELKNSGNVVGAEKAYDQVDSISNHIVELLNQAEFDANKDSAA